ncbi:hypothetical protein WMF39_36705 [Sorangium sp. So ce1504]|uniref:hypothetical protein n=1 Tax=Sorangium sp. So ce1504 TaxID=3133337 RepID=UPI003F62954D
MARPHLLPFTLVSIAALAACDRSESASAPASAEYEPAGPGRWKTTRADMSGLRVETKATLGGRDMPVPATNAFSGMDRPGTLFEYRCEGDVFKLKPIVEGMATDFITMKRVP